MKIQDKIEKLNEYVGGTLSVIYYTHWELYSYGKKSLFQGFENYIHGESFVAVIDKAYKIMKDDQR